MPTLIAFACAPAICGKPVIAVAAAAPAITLRRSIPIVLLILSSRLCLIPASPAFLII
jgi:hypothetical protein